MKPARIFTSLTFISCAWVFLYMLMPLLMPAQTEQEEGLASQDLFSVGGKEGVACYRIPAIITAIDGTVIVAIDERHGSCGDLRYNENINIVIRRSLDNGISWTETETIVDYPFGESASDPSMILDRETGNIFLFFNYMDLVNEPGIYYHRVMISTNNGNNWSEPVDITTHITKPEWHDAFKIVTSGGGTQAEDGSLLHVVFLVGHGAYIFGSEDHGVSWKLLSELFQPADESKIVELPDGSWMVNSRVNGTGLRYVHISDDKGQTWISRSDSSLVDPGCNAALLSFPIQTGNSRQVLLFSNACNAGERKRMTVKISPDDGQSWPASILVYPGSAAYSSMTILGNGDMGLIFEKDGYTETHFVVIPAKSIMEKISMHPD